MPFFARAASIETEIIAKSVKLSLENGEFFTWETMKYLGCCEREKYKISAVSQCYELIILSPWKQQC